MKFTQVPVDTMQAIQINAGMIVDDFDPSTGVIGNQLAATGGGTDFNPNPQYVDAGKGIDNMPENTWQLKRIDHYEPHLTGTFKTMKATLAKMLQAGATISSGHIIPTHVLAAAHFTDCWLLGDYGDKNVDGVSPSTAKAGFIAIHLMNAMNVLGFRWKSNDKDKGDFAFDFLAHYDIQNIDTVPFELYVVEGTAPTLASLTVTSTAGTASGDSNIAVSGYSLGSGESYVYKTAASAAPTVAYGDDVSTWTALTSGSDITPAAGDTKITVAVKDAYGRAVGSGSATLVKNT